MTVILKLSEFSRVNRPMTEEKAVEIHLIFSQLRRQSSTGTSLWTARFFFFTHKGSASGTKSAALRPEVEQFQQLLGQRINVPIHLRETNLSHKSQNFRFAAVGDYFC
ncbi:MAG TPA: hypothetical protein VND65_16460 [Candidatus Binatia bacterium]|nr:hypothetical protein [Candidatus Binatia bacterium]